MARENNRRDRDETPEFADRLVAINRVSKTVKGGKRFGFAALVALLSLIHPLHSEVVNNVKSRDELLCLSFGLGAIIQLLKYLDTRKWWNFLSALLLVLCALLCKKTGIVFIPIALLTAVYVRRINWKHFFIFIGSLVFAFVAFKLIKSGFIDKAVSREMQFFENPLYFSDSIMDRIPMYFYSI